MSEANVALVRRLTELAEEEGFEAAIAVSERFWADDIEWIEDPSWPGGGTYRGASGIRQVLKERTDSFDVEQHTEKLIDAGDEVVAFIRWRGRGHSSGAEAEMRVATVTTLCDGKIVRVRFFLDRSEALKAVGLNSEPG